MIILMAGLPGTGKTTLAHELATRTSGRVLGKDEIRQALFAAKEIEYSSGQDDFCMQVLLGTADFLLRQNPKRFLFLDGRPFSRRYQIENVVHTATSLHQPWRLLECVCSEETVKRRIAEQSAAGGHPAGNRDFRLYLEVKTRFEAIMCAKTVIDTDQSLANCIEQALSALR